jgi:probable HAF family extracellular repeat protein
MLTKQIISAAAALLLMTGVAAAKQTYKTIDLSNSKYPESAGAAAIVGQQAGSFTVGYYKIQCAAAAPCIVSQTHGALWTPAGARTSIDLNPAGYFSTTVTGLAAGRQVGFGYATKPNFTQQYHALMWSGSAQSMIDLNPLHFDGSIAHAIDGLTIVGSGYRNGVGSHALVWFGTPAVMRDLNPPGYAGSEALAAANGYQAGYVMVKGVGPHAYIWHGSPFNGRDLNPRQDGTSYISGIFGNVAIGAVTTEYGQHAYMWNSLSSSVGIDLNTSQFVETAAVAASGNKQVGWGEVGTFVPRGTPAAYHAVVWFGSAGSCIDLQRFLPVGFVASKAVAIAPDGTILGIAEDKSGKTHAFLWVPQHLPM